jgi:cellulose synthase (UDP-forming)
MPESFESSMKQRIRWAMGHVQILFQTNPLTMRGLTFPQRIGYFASIFYFLHGVPRIVCLVAPLFALLFGIIPVTADVPSLLNFFGSYYLATLVMLRTVSRGTRNAFWSDIYVTAGSIALSWATLKTAIRPWMKRPFVITPKGVAQERPGFSRFSYILPHLIIMGLLIAGLVTGIRLWMAKVPLPGLEVSLFWGSVNLILVGVAILAAAELPEWRKAFRIRHRLSCELFTEEERFSGTVEDLNESGALIHVNRQLLGGKDHLFFSVISPMGDRLTSERRICRQERVSSDVVEIGLKFIDVDAKTADSLIAVMFFDSRAWNEPEVEPGIFRSLWSIFRVFRMVFVKSRTSHRRYVRVPYRQDCRLVFQGRTLDGTVDKISKTGLSVYIPGTVDLVGETGILYVESVALTVRRSWAMQCEGAVVAGFTIEQVDKGADQWRELTSLAA